MSTVNYYNQVVRKMGGTRTAQFVRLFMVPGMQHCGGGAGADQFDMGAPIEKWVEGGEAPEQIIAAKVESGKVIRTHPLCAYPAVAKYSGTGSADEAANWSCSTHQGKRPVFPIP